MAEKLPGRTGAKGNGKDAPPILHVSHSLGDDAASGPEPKEVRLSYHRGHSMPHLIREDSVDEEGSLRSHGLPGVAADAGGSRTGTPEPQLGENHSQAARRRRGVDKLGGKLSKLFHRGHKNHGTESPQLSDYEGEGGDTAGSPPDASSPTKGAKKGFKGFKGFKKGNTVHKQRLSALYGDNTDSKLTAATSALFTEKTPAFKMKGMKEPTRIKFKGLSQGLNPWRQLYSYSISAPIGTWVVMLFGLCISMALVFTLIIFMLPALDVSHTDGETVLSRLGRNFATLVALFATGFAGEMPVPSNAASSRFWIWQFLTFLGMVYRLFAMAMVFRRLMSPAAKVIFSKWAIVTDTGLTQARSLEFRITTSILPHEIMQANVQVVAAISPRTGPPRRRYYPLELVSSFHTVMPYIWTVSHVIDKASPLYGESWQNLATQNLTLLVLYTGIEGATMEEICVTHTYKIGHLLFDGSFLSLLSDKAKPYEDKEIVLDFSKFHHARALKPVNHRGV